MEEQKISDNAPVSSGTPADISMDTSTPTAAGNSNDPTGGSSGSVAPV